MQQLFVQRYVYFEMLKSCERQRVPANKERINKFLWFSFVVTLLNLPSTFYTFNDKSFLSINVTHKVFLSKMPFFFLFRRKKEITVFKKQIPKRNLSENVNLSLSPFVPMEVSLDIESLSLIFFDTKNIFECQFLMYRLYYKKDFT